MREIPPVDDNNATRETTQKQVPPGFRNYDTTLQHHKKSEPVSRALDNILAQEKYKKKGGLTQQDIIDIRKELNPNQGSFRLTSPKIANFFRPDELENEL